MGNLLSLCYETGEEFAKGKVISVKETIFKELTEEDWEGHESFMSDEHMYSVYSKYYNTPVTSGTKLKIIRFQLIDT